MSSQSPVDPEVPPPARAAASPLAAQAGLLACGLLLLVIWVFAPVLDGAYVYDDELLFGPANPATASLGAALGAAFEPLWTFDGPAGETFERAFWRPLTVVAMAAGRGLGDGAPWGPHALSLLLHLVATLAAWRLAARLLGGTLPGLLVAALFALHPVQAEPVAWAAAVNDPLWGALGLWALVAHARWRDRRGDAGAPWLAGGLTFLALLSKEQALIVPVLAAALDLALGRRHTLRAYAPYLVALGVWFAARVAVYGDVFGGLLTRQGDFEFQGVARELSFRVELLGGFVRLLAWPTDLAVFRPVQPVLPPGSGAVIAGALWLLGALAALAVALWRGWRTAAFALGVALVPPLLIVQSVYTAGRYPLSDRYLYVAAFGAALALVALLRRLAPRRFATVLALGVAAAGAAGTRAHLAVFSGPLAFFEAAAVEAPRDPYVRLLAGRAQLDEYRRTLDKVHLERAYLHYLESLAAGTDYGAGQVVDDPSLPINERIRRIENMVHLTPPEERSQDPTVFWTALDRLEANLGQLTCLALAVDVSPLADLSLPAEIARQLVQIFPDDARTWIAKGQVHERGGELDDAETAYRRGLERDRTSLAAWRRLAAVHAAQGETGDARRCYEEALRLQPGDPALLVEALGASIAEGQLALARGHLEGLVAAAPGTREAAFWRGRLALAEGRPDDALAALDRALELDPDWGDAHKQRSLALLRRGEVTQAMEALGRAAALLPDDFETHYQLAALMLANPPPGADARYEQRTTDILARAYVFAPPDGQRLQLQEVLLPRIARDPDALAKMGTTMRGRGDSFSARVWFDAALGVTDRWPEERRAGSRALLLTQLGQLEREARRPVKARDLFREAVALAPGYFEARFDLATSLRQLEDFEAAATEARAALELVDGAGIAPEALEAVRETLERIVREADDVNQAGPLPPR